MATDVQRKAEELVRYYSELMRRLSQAGVRDVSELLALYEQLRRALDAVSRQEITWAMEQTQGLIEGLVTMDACLQSLRGLKAALAGDRAT